MEKQPCVYLLTSGRNGTLYCGVTSDLVQRVWQHREHLHQALRRDAAGLVRAASRHGIGDPARKADQAVESRMEDAADRRVQSVVARFVARHHQTGAESRCPWIPAFAGMTAWMDDQPPAVENRPLPAWQWRF